MKFLRSLSLLLALSCAARAEQSARMKNRFGLVVGALAYPQPSWFGLGLTITALSWLRTGVMVGYMGASTTVPNVETPIAAHLTFLPLDFQVSPYIQIHGGTVIGANASSVANTPANLYATFCAGLDLTYRKHYYLFGIFDLGESKISSNVGLGWCYSPWLSHPLHNLPQIYIGNYF